MVGLDNAGKTTLLANLSGEPTEDITPTVGFSSTTMDIGRSTVTFYDLGGGPKIRDIWKNYYAKVGGRGVACLFICPLLFIRLGLQSCSQD